MSKIFTAIDNVNFKPHQIVCLEFSPTCLYGEVIQIIEQRKTCWVRPILIVQEDDIVEDIRSSSDLILPLCLFRPCLDTEILPFLPQLKDLNHLASKKDLCFDLTVFIREVWSSYQENFLL